MARPENQQSDVPGTRIKDGPLRSSQNWPNWSVVTSERGREALDAIVEVAGFKDKWSGLTAAEDGVRRAVLDLYAYLGHAPGVAGLAESTGMAPGEVRVQLGSLRKRDLIVLDETDGAIVGAYPFTEQTTGHRVRLGDRILNAMCAIDALGAGAMYQTDVTIDSSCLRCGAGIRIATWENGAALETTSPPSATPRSRSSRSSGKVRSQGGKKTLIRSQKYLPNQSESVFIILENRPPYSL